MSGDRFLILYNNICYCAAYLALLSASVRLSKAERLLCFLGLLLPSLLLMRWVALYQLVYPALLALPLRRREGGYLSALYLCFGGISLLWGIIMGCYALAVLIAPDWPGSFSYNMAMGALILVLGGLSLRFPRLLARYRTPTASSRYILLSEGLVIGFFQLVYPHLYGQAELNPRHRAIVLLALLALLWCFGWLVSRAKVLEHRAASQQLELERRSRREREIQNQYKAVITLDHYFHKVLSTMGVYLRDGRLPELTAYFEKHISPIYQRSLAERENLEGIRDELLRNLIDRTAALALSTMPHIVLQVEITGVVELHPDYRLPVVEIVSIYLDNAIECLRSLEGGKLVILMDGARDGVTIHISNTVPEGFSLANLRREPDGRHGYGLSIVRELVEETPDLQTYTRLKGGCVVQQLDIRREAVGDV